MSLPIFCIIFIFACAHNSRALNESQPLLSFFLFILFLWYFHNTKSILSWTSRRHLGMRSTHLPVKQKYLGCQLKTKYEIVKITWYNASYFWFSVHIYDNIVNFFKIYHLMYADRIESCIKNEPIDCKI